MARTIVLTDGRGKKFVLSGATQIGRYSEENKRKWAVPEREQPAVFGKLEAIIHVEEGYVSRNHTAIFGKEGGEFHIEDLNSLNGTKVNGSKLPKGGFKRLQEGDTIAVSSNCSFKVSFTESQDYALLVGGKGDHPGAIDASVSALQREVRRRGYVPYILKGDEATKQAVKDKIDEIKHLSVPESHVFFYFHSHGGSHGIKLGLQYLNPRELYHKINQVRGRKAVVIDCCRAGIFVDDSNKGKIPEGTLVLTASSPEGNAGESLLAGGEQGGKYMPRFSKAIVDYLQAHPEEFNLRKFYSDARGTFGANLILQEPLMEGDSYLVPQERTELCSLMEPTRAH